jgi:hypothetical protein
MSLPTRPSDPMRGSYPARLSQGRPVILFAVGLAAIVVVVLAILVAFAPKPPPQRCPDPDQPCSPIPPRQGTIAAGGGVAVQLPPPSTSTAPLLRNGTAWADPASGVQIDYDSKLWTLEQGTPEGLALLTAGQGSIVLRIEVDKASDVDAQTLLDDLEQFTDGLFTGVTRDNEPRNVPLHPQIGYRDALGEYLVGTSSEGGQITNYGFTLVTATDAPSNATIGVLVAVPEPDRLAGQDPGSPRILKLVGGLVDEVMKHVFWARPQ